MTWGRRHHKVLCISRMRKVACLCLKLFKTSREALLLIVETGCPSSLLSASTLGLYDLNEVKPPFLHLEETSFCTLSSCPSSLIVFIICPCLTHVSRFEPKPPWSVLTHLLSQGFWKREHMCLSECHKEAGKIASTYQPLAGWLTIEQSSTGPARVPFMHSFTHSGQKHLPSSQGVPGSGPHAAEAAINNT